MGCWRSAAAGSSSCGRRSAACSPRKGCACTTAKAAAVMLGVRRGAPKPRSSALSAWPRWTAWSTSGGWCTSPWSWLLGRRLTFGVRRKARRGTLRSLWRWCAIRTCRPCKRDGTDTCPQRTWAALGRMRSSDRGKSFYLLGANPSQWTRVEDTSGSILWCTALWDIQNDHQRIWIESKSHRHTSSLPYKSFTMSYKA